MNARTFIACVQGGDAAALVKLPGIGKKTAERLIIELRDRLDALAPATAVPGTPVVVASSPVDEAVSALVGLGYKAQEASSMVRVIDTTNMSSEDIIRNALQTTLQ